MNFLNPLIVPPSDPDYKLMGKYNTFMYIEHLIDDNAPLYLMTWCPAEDELPDCDFDSQHAYFANLIVDYIKSCKVGLFCVESTQRGNPHYHGWYQVEPKFERQRILMVKVLQRFGIVKITKSKGHYKKGSFSNVSNCLYYYKKDSLDAMYEVETNPIHALSTITIDHNEYAHFFNSKMKTRKSVADIEDKLSLAEFYKRFYANSIF